jgi:hypothetical protein
MITLGRARELQDRLLVYRRLVRADLTEPVESICYVTQALMEQAGLWEDCLAAFLTARCAQGAFYRDLAATFLGWLVASGWGQDRWPFLLPLVHFELLTALVAHHPGGDPDHLHPAPRLGDVLVLAPPTQLVTYPYQVHLATVEAPVPEPGTTHLLAYRDADGAPHWMELTPATAALLLNAQRLNIGQTALDLDLTDLSEAVELLGRLRTQGAIAGFTPLR